MTFFPWRARWFGSRPPRRKKRLRRCGARPFMRRALDGEAFAATALRLAIGVMKFEPFVQSFAHEVQLGSSQIRQALRIDQERYTLTLEFTVGRLPSVREFHGIRQTGTARRAHAQAQADSAAALSDGFPHSARSFFR